MEGYLQALWTEIRMVSKHCKQYRIDTIFMGGGTPTLFHGHSLAKTLMLCGEVFNLDRGAEISIECNPGTVDADKLRCLSAAGFNRLSIGLQAWQDEHLKALGRIHRREDFLGTMEAAKVAGFKNISADVMYGLPNQTVDAWMETLIEVASTGISHLSAYGLKIEEGTPFHTQHMGGHLALPEEDVEMEMGMKGNECLQSLGFKRYEISNYARSSYQCRHNLNYWQNGQYLGLGSGAHAYMDGIRRANISDIFGYIEKINKGMLPIAFEEIISKDTEMFETIMLGLRLVDGIEEGTFIRRYGISFQNHYAHAIEGLSQSGLLEVQGSRVKPTDKGLDLQNIVALAFMDER